MSTESTPPKLPSQMSAEELLADLRRTHNIVADSEADWAYIGYYGKQAYAALLRRRESLGNEIVLRQFEQRGTFLSEDERESLRLMRERLENENATLRAAVTGFKSDAELLAAYIKACREAFAPVLSWYAAEGEEVEGDKMRDPDGSRSLPDMLRDAVSDLVAARADALLMARLRKELRREAGAADVLQAIFMRIEAARKGLPADDPAQHHLSEIDRLLRQPRLASLRKHADPTEELLVTGDMLGRTELLLHAILDALAVAEEDGDEAKTRIRTSATRALVLVGDVRRRLMLAGAQMGGSRMKEGQRVGAVAEINSKQ